MKKYIGIILGIILIAVIITVVIVTKNKQVTTSVLPPDNATVFDTALTTKHISTPDMVWPPAVKLSVGVFSCNAQGTDTSETGKVELKTIGGTQYCVTTRSEGAAGSMYTTYTYTTEIKNQLQQLHLHYGLFSVIIMMIQKRHCAKRNENNSVQI